MEELDLFHPINIFPRTLKSTKSNFGIIITIAFFLYIVYYFIFEECLKYHQKYIISFKQDFLNINEDTKKNITFGIKIDKSWINDIKFDFLNKYNNIIDNNLIKICDENLREIKNIGTSENNFLCLIDYPLKGSNISNHIIKIRLKINDTNIIKLNRNNDRIPLYIKFKEPILDHDNPNEPFFFKKEIIEYTYYYSLNFYNIYRKYIKIIDYITETFFSTFLKSSAYLEDYEDSSKSVMKEEEDKDEDKYIIIGSFRLCLSKKKDIFVRKYAFWKEFFAEIFAHIGLIMTIISIIERLFIKKMII